MTTAYWSVLIVIVIPYFLVLMARLPSLTLERNLIPRLVSDEFTGFRQRSYWAHLNALEAIAPFSAAIIIAHMSSVPQATIDTLALTFIVFRVVHALFYIANKGVLRTLSFVGGMTCIILLFIKAAA